MIISSFLVNKFVTIKYKKLADLLIVNRLVFLDNNYSWKLIFINILRIIKQKSKIYIN